MGFGGTREELKRQDGGKRWRIEEVDRSGGIGVDSEEKIGKVDIDRSRIGGIDGSEAIGFCWRIAWDQVHGGL